jgi:cyclophilin family peptidyl-prolyl cis-trans isomerase
VSRSESPGTFTVVLNTSLGAITLELDAARAPLSAANFLQYLDAGHYDGTIFHRVIPGFVIQGGGHTRDFRAKPTRAPIRNESGNGLRNAAGSVAMARTSDLDSATAQFYINLKDNRFLDDGRYTVFGQVVDGMDVVERIAAVKTGRGGPFSQDCPLTPVAIESAVRQPAGA